MRLMEASIEKSRYYDASHYNNDEFSADRAQS